MFLASDIYCAAQSSDVTKSNVISNKENIMQDFADLVCLMTFDKYSIKQLNVKQLHFKRTNFKISD